MLHVRLIFVDIQAYTLRLATHDVFFLFFLQLCIILFAKISGADSYKIYYIYQ